MEYQELMARALEARKSAYVPYSDFLVGAALLTKKGKVYCGCNIENASYSVTVCAERTAFFKAASEGEREYEAIAIAGGMRGAQSLECCYPCGVCRQVMREFCEPEFLVITGNGEDILQVDSLASLLPNSFGPENLQEASHQ